jgi:plasmid stabilization system protein ParE
VAGLTEIISYLERNFSEKDVQTFIRKFEKLLHTIQLNPGSFPVSPYSKKARRAILSRLTSVYYIADEETIKLVTIFDNRKNPGNLNL